MSIANVRCTVLLLLSESGRLPDYQNTCRVPDNSLAAQSRKLRLKLRLGHSASAGNEIYSN